MSPKPKLPRRTITARSRASAPVRASRPARLTPWQLYELCVARPEVFVRFLEAIGPRARSGVPHLLREDFSGSGGLARAWAARHGNAVAVDIDPAVLRLADGTGVRTVRADAANCRVRADLIVATNFAIGYWHSRAALLTYLRRVCASLPPGGVFVCDLYGGADAFRTGQLVTLQRGPSDELIEYTFEQRSADALSARVQDVLHFRVSPPGARSAGARGGYHYRNAFVYDWRLWSLPELRDALVEVGFGVVEVYAEVGDAVDEQGALYPRPITTGDELDENWVVYVVARRDGSRPHARGAGVRGRRPRQLG